MAAELSATHGSEFAVQRMRELALAQGGGTTDRLGEILIRRKMRVVDG